MEERAGKEKGRRSGVAVHLTDMPQQLEVRITADDWTGRTSATERRKLQNRLNQRIYRRRRAAKQQSSSIQHFDTTIPPSPEKSAFHSDSIIVKDAVISAVIAQDEVNHERQSQDVGTIIVRPTIHNLGSVGIQKMMVEYENSARRDYVLGSPRVDQLLTLIQFNVFRALVSNTFSLGFTMDWLEEDAVSPWSSSGSPTYNLSCPKSLLPTRIQKTIPHHPWIDLFPIPKMRDNLLIASDSYDETSLCNDLVEFCDVPNEQTGLIVWKEPWDPSGWEVSDAFLAKWGWVVEGCNELITSTNYWRQRRGEKALVLQPSNINSIA